jgi:hypothetical protein
MLSALRKRSAAHERRPDMPRVPGLERAAISSCRCAGSGDPPQVPGASRGKGRKRIASHTVFVALHVVQRASPRSARG